MKAIQLHLLPVSHFQHGFTTNSALHVVKVDQVPLRDAELHVHKVTSRTSHEVVSTPPPAHPDPEFTPPDVAWEAFYPKGSINPSASIPGGFGFYLTGPQAFTKSLENGATEAVMSYRMMLQEDWEWVKGGKLPGIFGGVGDLAYGCSGGRQKDRCSCFSARLMWRAKSLGELYVYAPLTSNNETQLLAVPPLSVKNADYGFSVGRGSFKISTGKWFSVALRVKLNDVGKEDGEIEVWIDGVSVISISGMTLREVDGGRIRGMHFQTFFGGHKDDWASPKDQRAWFADVSGVIIK